MQTLADIFMDRITKWDHQNISDLNPGVELPNDDIILIISTAAADENLVLTTGLSATDQEFGGQIGITNSPNFSIPASRIWDVDRAAIAEKALATPYSLTVWGYDCTCAERH